MAHTSRRIAAHNTAVSPPRPGRVFVRGGGAHEVARTAQVRVGGALRAPRRQSLLRSQARCALLVSSRCPQHTPRTRSETGTDRLLLWASESVGKRGRPSLVLPRARTVARAAQRARILQGWARGRRFLRVRRKYGG